jgi:DNA-binding response OmpR family regulator
MSVSTIVPARQGPGAAEELPLTLTISLDGRGGVHQERVLAALRELITAAGAETDVAITEPPPSEPPLTEPPPTGSAIVAAPAVGPASARTGVFWLDPRARAVLRDGKLLDLSRLEYDLLLFLAENPRQVFTRAQLLAKVWGHVHAGARTVDVHVSRLRIKLDSPDLITTVYGVGYRLADNAPIRLGVS